jgi:tRNA (mo5U34)-methyltransferase
VTAELARRAAELAWYHTIELPGGVLTSGWFDTHAACPSSGLPDSLEGMRCLDIGTCDGFWAFEMERRGAAEVVAVDIEDPAQRDWPEIGVPESERGAGAGRSLQAFALASEALGSRVERRALSIYDLAPERVGQFDFVFIGSLLLHLRDPVGALMAARSVCAGTLLCMDAVSRVLTRISPRFPAAALSRIPQPRWWTPNRAGLTAMVERAGFEPTSVSRIYYLPWGAGHPRKWRRSARDAAFWLTGGWRGAAVVSVHARPRGASALP